MTRRITAIVEHGVLRPTVPLDLPEGTEVQIVLEPAKPAPKPPPDPRDVAARVAILAALPEEPGPEFSNRDHDRILYGEGGAR